MSSDTMPDEIFFADPYKRCGGCSGWIDGVRHSADRRRVLIPCGCELEYVDVCPSWSPIQGCNCVRYNTAVLPGNPVRQLRHPMRRPAAGDTRVYGPASA